MFGKCLKNYFVSLKYIFAVLGILFLGLLIGGSILRSGITKSFDEMTAQIVEITEDSDLSTDKIWMAIKSEFLGEYTNTALAAEVDSDDDLFVSGQELQDYSVDAVSQAIASSVDNYAEYVSEIAKVVSQTFVKAISLLLLFFVIQIFAIIISRSSVLAFDTGELEHRNVLKLFGARCLHSILLFVYLLGIVAGIIYIPQVGGLLLVIFPLVYCIMSLFCANVSVGKKRRAPIGKSLHIKYILLLLITNLLELMVTLVLGIVIYTFLGFLTATYVVIALCIVASVAVSMNAETIVYRVGIKYNKGLEKNKEADDMQIVELDDSTEESLETSEMEASEEEENNE